MPCTQDKERYQDSAPTGLEPPPSCSLDDSNRGKITLKLISNNLRSSILSLSAPAPKILLAFLLDIYVHENEDQ